MDLLLLFSAYETFNGIHNQHLDFRINEAVLDQYVIHSTAKNKSALRKFLVTLSEATYETFDKVTDYDDIPGESYMSLLLDLQFDFRPTVSNSGNNKHAYGITRTITEIGICYSFNSQLAVYNSPEYELSYFIIYLFNKTE